MQETIFKCMINLAPEYLSELYSFSSVVNYKALRPFLENNIFVWRYIVLIMV